MGKKGPRAVAVALALHIDELRTGRDKVLACIVSSRKHDEWVLPKGGVEKGESAREAAARELWEEGMNESRHPDTQRACAHH